MPRMQKTKTNKSRSNKSRSRSKVPKTKGGSKSKGGLRSRKVSKKNLKYRGKGGCANGSCALNSSSQPWISKGGAFPEDLISEDIYNHRTDPIFYSSA